MKNKNSINILVRLVIMFFVVQLMVPAILFYPQKASAQVGGVVTDPALTQVTVTKEGQDALNFAKEQEQRAADKAWQETKDSLTKGLILSAAITLRNTLVSMARTAATQSYEFVTTGSFGQGPMFYDQAWGKFQDDIMANTVGQFLTNLQDVAWNTLGFDICDPSSEAIKLKIVIGMDYNNKDQKSTALGGTALDCSWSKLTTNWEGFIGDIETMASQFKDQPFAASMLTLQKTFEVSFDRKSSDVGIYLNLEDELSKNNKRPWTRR